MMRLDTDPMTPGRWTARGPVEALPMLIRVPRVVPPMERSRARRPGATISTRPIGRRPRRRLRRGVRQAGLAILMLTAMAGTLAIGWTTRGGGPSRLPLLKTAGPGSPESVAPVVVARDIESDGAADLVTGPDLGAPVAEAEPPVVFPGYLLPDNHRDREEPAHEGS